MEHPDSSAQPQAIPGSLIRSAREALLLSQDHLARAAGVSVSTIARMEKGNPVSAESLKAVCAVIGLDAVTVHRVGLPPVVTPPPLPEDRAAPVGAGPSPSTGRVKRWAAGFGSFARFVALSTMLSLVAAEVGMQTSEASMAERREAFNDGLLSVALLLTGGEINQASVLYSSALPGDHPMRAWQPWKRMKPVNWMSCASTSYMAHAMAFLASVKPDENAHCRDLGFPMRMTRRDDVRTDFVVGPATGHDLGRLLSMLTSDPTVSILAFTSPLGDVPPAGAAWHDPRVNGYQSGLAEGKGWHVHLRLSRNAS